MNKPYSESCDENREPILTVLRPVVESCKAVLELGSGTGQHAVYFARQLPHLVWHTSDREEYHPGIRQWLIDAALENTRPPIILDVLNSSWPELPVDAVFTANTAHIMHDDEVAAMMQGVGNLLADCGQFILYGPVNYNRQYTSESNRKFDCWLKDRDPLSGIPHFEDLHQLASIAGLTLKNDFQMPANNRILVWQKSAA